MSAARRSVAHFSRGIKIMIDPRSFVISFLSSAQQGHSGPKAVVAGQRPAYSRSSKKNKQASRVIVWEPTGERCTYADFAESAGCDNTEPSGHPAATS